MPNTQMLDWNRIQRVLILRLSSIGDVVHALPVLHALHTAYPHLEISWIVEEMSAEILLGNPILKEVIVIPRSRWKKGRTNSLTVWREMLALLKELRGRKFDLTLDLQGYAKSGVLAKATGAKYRFGWCRLRDGAQLVSHRVPHQQESLHRVDWFLDVVRALGIAVSNVVFPLAIPMSARESLKQKLQAQNISGSYLVLNLATGNEVRRWGVEKYAELVSQIDMRFAIPILLIGSTKDCSLNNALLERVKGTLKAPLLNIAGETSLMELAVLLEGCAAHITGDTGSTHIAAAVACPVIGLYGPTDPAHAGAWGQAERALSRRELCTKGCGGKACATPCPRPHPATEAGEGANVAKCLNAITPKEIIELLEPVLI
jgi:lipopolysaccharide heptosyltransferase I